MIYIISQQRTMMPKAMLAMLLQRRMEILNQLETIIGKQQQQLMSPQMKTVRDYLYFFIFFFRYLYTTCVPVFSLLSIRIKITLLYYI